MDAASPRVRTGSTAVGWRRVVGVGAWCSGAVGEPGCAERQPETAEEIDGGAGRPPAAMQEAEAVEALDDQGQTDQQPADQRLFW